MAAVLPTNDQRGSSLSHNPEGVNRLPIPGDSHNPGTYPLCHPILRNRLLQMWNYVELLHSRI
jgi:hypothetical protein